MEAGRSELDRITGGAIHQGLALRIKRYSYADPADLVEAARASGEQPLIVALDGVTDPRNLGAVARSVAAFGGHGILRAGPAVGRSDRGAWKASAGHPGQGAGLPRRPTWPGLWSATRRPGCSSSAWMPAAATDIGDLELADSPLVLVVGSEGKGLSRLVRERCDVVASIPMTGPAESLNAGHRSQHRAVRGVPAARLAALTRSGAMSCRCRAYRGLRRW